MESTNTTYNTGSLSYEEKQAAIKPLNELLRGELSAVETYRQVLDQVRDEPEAASVQRILQEHSDAVETLREHVQMFGGKPDETSGVWGAFAKTVTGSAKIFGDMAALKALKEGEEHGLREYEDILEEEGLASICRQMITTTFLPRQRNHIAVIDGLMKSH